MTPSLRNVIILSWAFGVSMIVNIIIASVQGLDAKVALQCSSAEYLQASDLPEHKALVQFCSDEGYYVGR